MESPKTFFQLCLNFICNHLNCVESLLGFPESIGKKILVAAFHLDSNYDKALSTTSHEDLGLDLDYVRKSLQIFFEAYADKGILERLSLQKDPFFLSETIDGCWWLYQHVSHLDLSYCGLGDDHDVLPKLLSSTFRLKTLILRENVLTDEGIRKLTLRNRMFKENVLSLETLDLSDNLDITEKSFGFLSFITKLSVIDVSNTRISAKAVSRLKLPSRWRALPPDYECKTGCECIRNSLIVTSSGWGAKVVEIWRKQLIKARNQRAEVYQLGRARLATIFGDTWRPPSFYNQLGDTVGARKDTNGWFHHKIQKTNGSLIFVSRPLSHCSHSNVLEANCFSIDTEKKVLYSTHCAGNSAITGYQVLKRSCSDKIISEKNNQCRKEKTKDFFFFQDPENSKTSEKTSKLLPCAKNLGFQMETKKTLKRLYRECDSTLRDDSQLPNVMTPQENAILLEYQCCQSSLSSRAKRSKKSLLDVLDEYM